MSETLDALGILPGAVEFVIGQREQRERAQGFFNDPVGWAKYMLNMDLWSKQREVVDSVLSNKSTAVKAGHGVGKDTHADTPIWTPEGFVRAGDLKVGDTVYDEAGQPTQVTGVSPVWDRPEWRVVFDDGTEVLTSPEHEWNVLDLVGRRRGVSDWSEQWGDTRTYETRELAALGLKTTSNQNRWRIPLAAPVQMPEANLLVDPYLLGFWLGDGTRISGNITVGKTKEGLFDWLDENGYTYSKKWVGAKNAWTVCPYGLQVQLRELGVLGNKHIPAAYLTASETQRRELLAGLMDADGFQNKSEGGPDVGMDTTDEQMSKDLYVLLTGLGCKVFKKSGVAAYTKDGQRHVTGTRYRLNWTPLQNPFKIRGENWREPTNMRSRHTQRTIVAVEPTGRRLVNFCIEVASPRHLYLAGESFVPTHNSLLSAVLVCWWVDTRYPDCGVATTAPSWDQVNTIIWDEIRKQKVIIEQRFEDGLIDHKLPGYITSEAKWRSYESGQTLAQGRRPPENKEESAFQGLHGRILAIGDEAAGLTGEIIDGLGNITTNEASRRLIIGNPTNPNSYFGKVFKEEDGSWNLISISVLESPNFTDEKSEMSEDALGKLSGPSYVEDKKIEYGEESARYRARILGEFAYDIDGDIFIRPEDLAIGYDTVIDQRTFEGAPVLGVDVSGTGEDSSIIYANYGGHVRFIDKKTGSKFTWETAQWIDRHAIALGAREVRIDSVGIGSGVASELTRLSWDHQRYVVIMMVGNAASPDKYQWRNARAYWWDQVRTALRAGEVDIDREDDTLSDEVTSVLYKYDEGTGGTGGLLIEAKTDMRKRGLKSPDNADAFMYAAVDMSHLYDNPLASLKNGDTIMEEPEKPAWAVFSW